MSRRSRGALVSLAALLVAGCAHKPAPGESIAEVCSVANDGHEVKASGYLQAPYVVGCTTGDCALQLSPSRKEQYGLMVNVPVGSGPNTITPLPPPAEQPGPGITVERVTVSIRDAEGGSVDVGDVVRVTGRMRAYEQDGKPHCELKVERLESL